MILFSENTVSETFRLIELVAFPDGWAIAIRGVLLPLATTIAYIYGYPYPSKWVYGFLRRRQKELLELRRKIEGETPLTIEDSRKLWATLISADAKHKEEVDQLRKDLAAANDQIEALREELKKSSAVSGRSALLHGIDPSQLEMLRRVERMGGKATEKTLLRSGTSQTKAKYDLGELIRLNLVRKGYDEDNGDFVDLTQEGRRFVLALITERPDISDAPVEDSGSPNEG